jgi:hypothetical protein
MGTDRLILLDEQWDGISVHIIGDERTRGSSGRDNRLCFLSETASLIKGIV